MLSRAQSARFDVLVVSEVSRLGRKPFEVSKTIEKLCEHGISIHIESLNLRTLDDHGNRSPMTDFFVAILAQFASMELETLRARIKSGLAEARRKGKHLGRRKGSVMSRDSFLRKHCRVVKDVRRGLSVRDCAKLNGVAANTVMKVRRILKES